METKKAPRRLILTYTTLFVALCLVVAIFLFRQFVFTHTDIVVSEWSGNNVHYTVGTLVTYKGVTYKCIQAHSSLPNLDPADVPALWQETQPDQVSNPQTPGGSQWPTYNPPPRVDPGSTTQNVTYGGGKVLDGKTNIYAIFWSDSSYQQPTPTYISLVTRFLNDFGSSPMYADLLQYTNASGNAPTSAQLAGTYTDMQPFPAEMKMDLAMSPQPDLGGFYHQEIISVAKRKGWDYQNYHNLFILFPIANNGCGAHGYLGDRSGENIPNGSPVAYASYPFVSGQNTCIVSKDSPNNDHTADIAIGEAAHELMETAADPYPGQGWGEIGDPCSLPSATINPQTQANVVWNGHPYLIQEMWDNHRNGCVLEGP